MAPFTRLVRFLAKDGRTYYGDAILPPGVTDIGKTTRARVLSGSPWGRFEPTDHIADVRQLLAPLAPEDCGTVRCLGLNYSKHAAESNMPLPSYPILFYKPATSLAGPFDAVPVGPMAREAPGLDYEAELVAVIGRRGRDISVGSALSHVAGYAVGNDVSHRAWQLERGGGQWGLGKGFDGWAPFGPGILAAGAAGDPQALRITARVNGRGVQDSSTADMVFGVAETVAFLSRGTTLLPGDLIFTGTPEGVALGKKPPVWLKDGDVVEVGLEGVGTCVNKIEYVGSDTAKL